MANRKSLAELKAALVERRGGDGTRTWGDFYTLAPEYVVGQAGRKRTGTQIHLLFQDVIVADSNPTPGWKEYQGKRFRIMRLGDVASSHAVCGTRSNGQHTTGAVAKGDTDLVNCERCMKRMGWDTPAQEEAK